MPYDSVGRWIPPDDSWRTPYVRYTGDEGWIETSAEEGGYQLSWDDIANYNIDPQDKGFDIRWDNRNSGYDLLGIIESGLLADIGIVPVFTMEDGTQVTSSRGLFSGSSTSRPASTTTVPALNQKRLTAGMPPISGGGDDTSLADTFVESVEGGTFDIDATLGNMFNTSQWNQATGEEGNKKRWSMIKRFQDYYYGEDDIQWAEDGEVKVLTDEGWRMTDVIEGFSEELRLDPNWGLDIQTDWNIGSDFSKWDDKDNTQAFMKLMGTQSDGTFLNQYFDRGAESDFRYYNKADQDILNAMRQTMFPHPEDYLQDYSTVEQIRDARSGWAALTSQEQQDALAWSDVNVEPYLDHQENADDDDAWEFHRTMEFDTETNTMSYYDYRTGRPKVDADGNPITHTIQPPADPRSMTVVEGEPPIALFNEDGDRIINESSANELYQKYLGRNATDVELGTVTTESGLTYDTLADRIKLSDEGQANEDNWSNKIYYNPQEYGSPESISAKMATAPGPISAPTITIRNIGQPKKPTNSYMALPSHWLTSAPQKVAGSTPGDTE